MPDNAEPVRRTPATDAGWTRPAGEGTTDEEFAAQVVAQTDPNLEVEDVVDLEAVASTDAAERAAVDDLR